MRKKVVTELVEHVPVTGLSHDGRGIAKINGKTTFLQGALSGEIVSFYYVRQKKDYDEGRVTEIHTPSADRVVPPCSHFEICGGCALQHLNSDIQIKQKQIWLLDLLQRIGKSTPDNVLSPILGATEHYRYKARLSVRYVAKKGGVLIGFREKNNPRYIADIKSCTILHPLIANNLLELRELIGTLSNPSDIAQVELSAGDDAVALIFRNLSPLSLADTQKLHEFANQKDIKIFLQPGGPDSVSLLTTGSKSDYLSYELLDHQLKYYFHPTDFTQINPDINPKMVNQAVELLSLDQEDVVLDLFCGMGNFSLPIAKHCKKVIGIEGCEKMVVRANYNAAQNNIDNAEFLAQNLDAADIQQICTSKKVNKWLLDPPRAGAYHLVKNLGQFKPEKIVYVSCNPATLARDTEVLVHQHGYRLSHAGVINMFPHTAHIESIAVFDKI